LKKIGKRVEVVNDREVPARLTFLPHANTIKTVKNRRLKEFDVLIVVDCGDLGRIGRVAELLNQKHFIINIDHHITNTNFGALNLVFPDASSTAEIIFDLLQY